MADEFDAYDVEWSYITIGFNAYRYDNASRYDLRASLIHSFESFNCVSVKCLTKNIAAYIIHHNMICFHQHGGVGF